MTLILRELDDIKIMIRQLSSKVDEQDQIINNWKGMALVAVTIISALVSVVIGLVVKHF